MLTGISTRPSGCPVFEKIVIEAVPGRATRKTSDFVVQKADAAGQKANVIFRDQGITRDAGRHLGLGDKHQPGRAQRFDLRRVSLGIPEQGGRPKDLPGRTAGSLPPAARRRRSGIPGLPPTGSWLEHGGNGRRKKYGRPFQTFPADPGVPGWLSFHPGLIRARGKSLRALRKSPENRRFACP